MLSENAITSWLAVILIGLLTRFVMVFVRHYEIKDPTWKDIAESCASSMLYFAAAIMLNSVASAIFNITIPWW